MRKTLTKAFACAVPRSSRVFMRVSASLLLKPVSGLTPVITGLGGASLSTTSVKGAEGLLALSTTSNANAVKV